MPNSEFNLLHSIIALVAGAGVAFVCYYLSKANLAEDLAPKRLYTLGFVGLAIIFLGILIYLPTRARINFVFLSVGAALVVAT